jgi:RNA polymerase sigma factor (TIGR02999 family)
MSSVPITRELGHPEDLALDKVYPEVYHELRRLARYYMHQERSNHTLQPTALVHEAYLRLQQQESGRFANRSQFISVAANMMRRILVNHAVQRNRQKRQGSYVQITLDRAVDAFSEGQLNLLDLEKALTELGRLDERQARVFELRFFGGLTVEETGEVLEISAASVKREWSTAKLFLRRELFGSTE